jgi:hypothetical protein
VKDRVFDNIVTLFVGDCERSIVTFDNLIEGFC